MSVQKYSVKNILFVINLSKLLKKKIFLFFKLYNLFV